MSGRTLRRAAAVGVSVVILCGYAAALADEPPLDRFLASVPAGQGILGDPIELGFIDVRALQRDRGLSPPEAAVVQGTASEGDPRLMEDALMRVGTPIELVNYLLIAMKDWRQTLGFAFSGVEWIGGSGAPGLPLTWFGIDAAVDPAAVTAALEARGFVPAPDGRPIWSRGEDLALDIRNREPEDPFGGWLGRSARILVLPRLLAGAPSWALIDPLAVAAADGSVATLADDPAFAALARALYGNDLFPDGPLQLFVSERSVERVAAARDGLPDSASVDDVAALQQRLDDGRLPGILPPFDLFAFADVNLVDGAAAAVLLAYRHPDDARIAAEVLAQRLPAYRSIDGDTALIPDRFRPEFETFVDRDFFRGTAVAGVVVRSARAETGTGGLALRGLAYRELVGRFHRSDVLWLAVGR